ncbi:hypothetical protein CN514_21425 [Bacillus sp. AFS001701]|uniref:hypothetical protein n=1 Tax=Bacillaceae TaxID=186817 RepID=UPI000BF59B7C|nr:hypothetical protein [Bacillus sp. AFS001701]PET44889.1 hypothetical protein CN514_21425 [Bacillus sp. AFS001701]
MYILGILELFVTIVLLVLVYQKRENKEETKMGWKIFGYWFLGTFKFYINTFSIPLGFVLYLLVMRPKTNIKTKRYAALIGLAGFIINLFL